MFELPPTDPRLPALFDPEIPNNPMLFATLLGRVPGRAWVDDPASPTHAMVRINGLLVFLSRNATQAFLEQGLETIKQFSHVGLIWRPGAAAPQLPKADRIIQRLEFPSHDFNSPTVAALIEGGPPAGFELREIDRALLERIESRDDIEQYCGSLENFLAHGFGACLVRDGEIVSDAYAPFVTSTNAELGVATGEAFRGRGYAALASASVIQACRARGLAPYWSCDADNLPSVSLARKLGFQDEREYGIHVYRRAPQ